MKQEYPWWSLHHGYVGKVTTPVDPICARGIVHASIVQVPTLFQYSIHIRSTVIIVFLGIKVKLDTLFNAAFLPIIFLGNFFALASRVYVEWSIEIILKGYL